MEIAQSTPLLTAALPAAMTVIGTLIGAGIAGFVALRVARAQTQTQREIARDAATRDRRDRQVAPLLEHANFVYSSYHRVLEYARFQQWDRVRAALEAIGTSDEIIMRVGWSALRRPHPNAFSMLEATDSVLAAQNACWATANRILAAIPAVPSELIDQLHQEANVLAIHLTDLHVAADRYVLERDRDPAPPSAISTAMSRLKAGEIPPPWYPFTAMVRHLKAGGRPDSPGD